MRITNQAPERRDPGRRPVQWTGRFGAPDTFGVGWTPCTVQNVSAHGATVVVVGGDAGVAVGHVVSIDIERVRDASGEFRVVGRVRHVETRDGTTTFGGELEFASPQERRTAQAIFSDWSGEEPPGTPPR